MSHSKKRALVLVGAGASVEFGIPATAGFGDLIEAAVMKDEYCVSVGGDQAYKKIKNKLTKHYFNCNSKERKAIEDAKLAAAREAHFERIYHVMHELSEFRVFDGAVPKHRPVIFPFLKRKDKFPDQALRAASSTMLKTIYRTVSEICDAPKVSMSSMTGFFDGLETDYIPRVYTTNYDDFLFQATREKYFTGFSIEHGDHLDFDARKYWSNWNTPGVFHLHGCIRMGFAIPSGGHGIGDVVWYGDKALALKHAFYGGSGLPRMDGTMLERGAIVTGLDKLGRLQQSPYASYYAGFGRDAMEADLILVLGSGLADLHLNTILQTAREINPATPLIYVGYWGGTWEEFYSTINFEMEDRDISLLHDLRIDLQKGDFSSPDDWVVDSAGRGAVWRNGFQSFLSQPEPIAAVLRKLM